MEIGYLMQRNSLKMKRFLIYIVCLCLVGILGAQTVPLKLLPFPNEVTVQSGYYPLSLCRLAYSKTLKNEADYLKQILGEEHGLSVQDGKRGNIQLVLSDQIANPEGYSLIVDKDGIRIEGATPQGVFYGIQTFRQLITACHEGKRVPCIIINDAPAFKWRSFMLDDGRAFKGVKEVKRLLDEMAILKMNIFHWHLTEDQGWRIEIKKYPLLTKIGAHRDSTQLNWYESKVFDGKPFEGFYTQRDIKEIVSYAQKLYITVVPEIEMPGHASAAIAAYPWLGSTNEKISVPCSFGVQNSAFNVASQRTRTFLKDVLDEVMELFPSKIIHIGGDEVRQEQWNNSPEIQAFMKEKGIGFAAELQVWFTNYIASYLKSKGRRMMGWNDITGDKLHGFQSEVNVSSDHQLSSDAVVQFWTGDLELLTKAAKRGYEIVNSLHEYTYLNYNHDKITPGLEYSFAPISLEKAYSFSPIPKDFPTELRKQIIGLGCQMWGEWIPQVNDMYKMVYPYWAAHAETGWTNKERKDYNRFEHSMDYFLTRWIDKKYIDNNNFWIGQH